MAALPYGCDTASVSLFQQREPSLQIAGQSVDGVSRNGASIRSNSSLDTPVARTR